MKKFLIAIAILLALGGTLSAEGFAFEAKLDAGWDSLPVYITAMDGGSGDEILGAAVSGLRAGGTLEVLYDFGPFGLGLDSTCLLGPYIYSSFTLWIDTTIGAFARVGAAGGFALDLGAGMRSFCILDEGDWDTIFYAEVRMIFSRDFALAIDIPITSDSVLLAPRIFACFKLL